MTSKFIMLFILNVLQKPILTIFSHIMFKWKKEKKSFKKIYFKM